MNYSQNAKQASYKLIVKEAKNDPTVLTLVPSFAAGINRLEALTVEIDGIAIQQIKNITGVTGNKNELMDDLCGYVTDVSGAVHSYAVAKNDKVLAAKVNFKESAIAKLPQAELITVSGAVLEEAGKIPPMELAHEGISNNEMTEFMDAYARFKDASSDTREAIIDRSGYTQKLADLFAEASDLKKNTLDRLASQFQRKNLEFYQKYKAASIIIYKRSPKTPPATEVK